MPKPRPQVAAQRRALGQPEPRCSFCWKPQHEVEWLIQGPTCFICNVCIDICHKVVAEAAEAPKQHV